MNRVRTATVLAAAAVALASGAASADLIYTHHNGYGFTDHVDVGVDVPADIWWANSFVTQPGGEMLTDVRVAFGAGWNFGTSPVSILVYHDLDNDGDADNLSLASQLDATAAMLHNVGDAGTVQTFDIPDTFVSGNFFIAVLAKNAPATAQIRSELTNPQGRSWLAVNETAALLGTFDPANPAGAEQAPVHIESLIPGVTGPLIDWYIEGVATVPAPGAAALLAGAGLAAVRRRRR